MGEKIAISNRKPGIHFTKGRRMLEHGEESAGQSADFGTTENVHPRWMGALFQPHEINSTCYTAKSARKSDLLAGLDELAATDQRQKSDCKAHSGH